MLGRWVLPCLLVVALACGLVTLRGLDVAPAHIVPASDRTAFSADRAYGHLQDLIAENVPHPPGSAAHQVIAERIVARLRGYGYETEVQEGLQCSTLAPGCSVVRNIVAVRHGAGSAAGVGPAVMITAHYDSVPGSAAACDDGAGIAVMLEIADLLANRAPMPHDVVFLFADAEESGLRGAMLFAGKHPLMKRVRLVVNLEARGVAGPSAMFETGAGNAGLIRLYADVVPRPVTNSLLFDVYRRMPNNTDFTIYRRAGASGFNFAFSRGASLYHSARDDLPHVDRASLQHQGENALAVLVGAATAPASLWKADTDAGYVDVGARKLLAWPATWTLPLAVFGLLLVVAVVAWRAPVGPRTGAWALLSCAVVLALVPAFGWLLSWPLGHWPDVHPLDHPYPWPGRIALLASTVLAVWCSASWFGRRAGIAAALTVTWLLLAIGSLALALLVPGAAFTALFPVLVYGVSGTIGSMRSRAVRYELPLIAATLAFVIAVWSGLYEFLLADVVLGYQLSQFKVVPLLLFALPLLPLAVAYAERGSSRVVMAGLVLVTSVAAATGALAPAHTYDRPRGVNLVYVQGPGTAPVWMLESFGNPGRQVLEAMGFGERQQSILRYGVVPWEAYVKPAKPQALPAPVVTVDDDVEKGGQRVIHGTVRSQRNAYAVMLGLADGAPVSGLRVEGQPVLDAAADTPRVVGLYGVGNAVTRFEITARPGVPFALVALDIAPLEHDGEAAGLLARRPVTAAPLQNGDQSIAMHRTQL